MPIELLPGESAVDLQYKGLFLLSAQGVAELTTDSVLLADFARAYASEHAVELCSGGGGVSILLHARTGCRVTGIELSETAAELSKRSLTYNGLSDIEFFRMDLKDAPKELGHGKFDLALCNPPYFTAGKVSPEKERALARHEGGCTLCDVCRAASALLKNGGRFSMIYPAESLDTAFASLTEHGLAPKRVRLVLPKQNAAPRRVLIEAKKGAKPGLTFEPFLIMHGEDGGYTAEMKRIYHMEG
ncbi:MAG: tRNA1(Val) (adenine(37)-N6)-methyltransferase [Clostridia bacterium]|nr:tRNA1(Val) (adenine(37)-N6)-methyltransferase [Clostridia bacterium]